MEDDVRRSAQRRHAWVCALALALLTPGIEGCLFHRAQLNVANLGERVADVVPGKTRIEELEHMIGGPATSITPLAGGNLLYAWTFGDTKTAGLTLILINVSRTNSGIDTALFVVDSDGVVQSQKVGQNSKDLSWQWWAFGG